MSRRHNPFTAAGVRRERPADVEAIGEVNRLAFDTGAEARLVELLRERGKLVVSLVAEAGAGVVGHIAFSRAVLREHPDVPGVGLGPMAVIPGFQNRGIGSALVRAGLAECAALGSAFAVVLGHPGYYPRFGFLPASRFGLSCRWQAPDGVFMALELAPGALAGAGGIVRYEPEFDDV